MKIIKIFVFALVVTWLIAMSQSCQQPGGNSAGSEYMPDMAHSIAYEANYYNYYYNNTWNGQEDYYQYAKPRTPVKGTIPRGYAGEFFARNGEHGGIAGGEAMEDQEKSAGIAYTQAGAVPYDYGNTEEERTRAMEEIVDNPYPITEIGLQTGKQLYDVYCSICHGATGNGLGYLVREASPGDVGGKYPVQPANLLLPEFVEAANGRYYHSIMYGRNMMGAYADKLNYEERWQVIHYIRSLQARELQLTYNQTENTLNSIDRPAGVIAPADVISQQSGSSVDGEMQSDEVHSDTGHENEH